MGDIYCAKCNEPYDAYHVYNHMSHREKTKFLAGNGCDACRFGTVCKFCYGHGIKEKTDHCHTCFSKGYVHVQKLLGSPDFHIGCNWHVAYMIEKRVDPDTVQYNPIIDGIHSFVCKDGTVVCGSSLCPDCDVSDYDPCPYCNGTGKCEDSDSELFYSSMLENGE